MKNILLQISILDKITKPLTKIQTSFDKTSKSVNALQRSFQTSFGKMKGRLRTLPNNINQLEEKLEGLKNKQKQAFSVQDIIKYQRAIRKTERELKKLENAKYGGGIQAFSHNLTSSIKQSIGGGLLAGGAIYTAYNGLKSIIGLSAQMEQTQVAFETMLGSTQGAKQMIDDLNQFANATPFDNTALYDNAKLLLNFGMKDADIIPTLKMLGDVSGGSKEKLDSLTLAFAQIQSQGKLTGQDLLQMINAGFNPLQEMAENMANGDVSKIPDYYKRLKEDMSKGLITSDMVAASFKRVTGEGGKFYKMMEKQSQTLAGQFSTIVGSIKLFAVQIGNALMPVIKKVAGITMKFVNFLSEHQGLAKAIGIGIMAVAGALAIWLPLQWAINLALTANPIGLIIVGVTALIAGITFLIVKIEKVYEWWKKIRLILLIIAPQLTLFTEGILQLFKAINYLIKYGYSGLKLWLQELLNEAIGIVNKIIKGINSVLGTEIKSIQEIKWVDKTQLEADRQKKKSEQKANNPLGIMTPADIGGGNNTTAGIIPGNQTQQVSNSQNISSITGGGTRPTNITVTFDKLVETLSIAAENVEMGIDEMETKLTEALTRVLNSAAEIAV